MIGLVLVSHSHLIAQGLRDLADQMANGQVQIAPAGGCEVNGKLVLGADAMRILQAIEETWSDDGVLVLVDLGSAVLSAELAIEMLPPEKQERCLVSNAPLVEGAIVAALHASMGESLEDVNAMAEDALNLRKIERG